MEGPSVTASDDGPLRAVSFYERLAEMRPRQTTVGIDPHGHSSGPSPSCHNPSPTASRIAMAAIDALPVCDFDVYLNKKEGWEAECAKVADCLYRTGILIVKDPVRPLVDLSTFFVSPSPSIQPASDRQLTPIQNSLSNPDVCIAACQG